VRLVYGVLHGLVLPGLAGGWDLGPAGRTHASAGPLSYELMTDALETGQEALSSWDAAGDRRPVLPTASSGTGGSSSLQEALVSDLANPSSRSLYRGRCRQVPCVERPDLGVVRDEGALYPAITRMTSPNGPPLFIRASARAVW
jgi:hypothetical protein